LSDTIFDIIAFSPL